VSFKVIIPARYESSRLANKVLQDIAGKPMLAHAYDRACESGAEQVIIATDHEKIMEIAKGFGAEAILTAADHVSGTERLCEAIDAMDCDDDDIIIGLQADEPLIPPALLCDLANEFEEHPTIKVASVCEKLQSTKELFDPNTVKVILNKRSQAVYFSRAPIPWDRATFDDPSAAQLTQFHYRHIGMYAYRASFLRQYVEWPQSPLERLESLEQLRILWNGMRIHMHVTKRKNVGLGVDTAEDLVRLRDLIK
jgi:3-deoxy-manno-octulosonate cytidylyltransferase (CMP-KDO synthetase)